MLSIFRTNQFFASILLFIYAAIVRASAFIIPSDWQPSNSGFLSEMMYQWIDVNSSTANILAIVLIGIQATFLNLIITQYRMAKEISLFPGLFYILLSSFVPDFLHLSPILMANTFYIMALYEMYSSYKQFSSADKNYNIGLWIAIGSLFYFPYAFFLLLGWIGLGILRAFKIKERIMMILGFLTPYIFALTHAYVYNYIDLFFPKYIYSNLSFFDLQPIDSIEGYVILIVFIIMIIITLLSMNQYEKRKNIQVQKNISILYWGMVITALTVIFQANINLEHLLMLAVPLGIFLSFNFSNMAARWAEVIHMFLLLSLMFIHFRPLIGI